MANVFHRLARATIAGLCWAAIGSTVTGVADAATPIPGPGLEAGQRPGTPIRPGPQDEIGRPRPAPPVGPLDGTDLKLGGLFIGNIELHRQRPLPNTAPTHEEMKAVATPPEFRTPPAVSFGWSWKSRR